MFLVSLPELEAEPVWRHLRMSHSAGRRRPDLSGQSESLTAVFLWIHHMPSLNSRSDAGKDHKKESCLTLQLLSVKCLHEQTSSLPSPKLNLIDSRPSFSVIFIHLDGCFVPELDVIHVAQLIRLQAHQYVASSSVCLNKCIRKEYHFNVGL